MDYPQEIIKSLAEETGIGMICYLNPDTMETDSVFGESYDAHWSGEYDDIYREVEAKIAKWEHCIRIDPPKPWESFKMMEDFIECCIPDNDVTKEQLWSVISGRKPFQYFKYIVEISPYCQQWFDFRQLQLEKHVRKFLEDKYEE